MLVNNQQPTTNNDDNDNYNKQYALTIDRRHQSEPREARRRLYMGSSQHLFHAGDWHFPMSGHPPKMLVRIYHECHDEPVGGWGGHIYDTMRRETNQGVAAFVYLEDTSILDTSRQLEFSKFKSACRSLSICFDREKPLPLFHLSAPSVRKKTVFLGRAEWNIAVGLAQSLVLAFFMAVTLASFLGAPSRLTSPLHPVSLFRYFRTPEYPCNQSVNARIEERKPHHRLRTF